MAVPGALIEVVFSEDYIAIKNLQKPFSLIQKRFSGFHYYVIYLFSI